MSSKVTKTEVVSAPPEKVAAVILDVEGYPNWQREMKKVSVLSKDDTGRPLTATFAISAMGQAAEYTVAFDYPAPNVIATHLTEGDMIVKQEQTYTLVEADGKTRLEYSLDMAVKWPVPDFMISAIINKGIKGNLSGIKTVAESA